MSNLAWLTNKGGGWRAESSMNSKVVLNTAQANALATACYNVSVGSLVFGDYSKWCASLIYYPLSLNPDTTEYKLVAGGIEYDTKVKGFINIMREYGFTLGESYYPSATSFLDFEPYTTLKIYLPYYGFIQLKIADVEGKYIQFRLYVDYNTGQAQYVVGVNSSSVESPNAPYVLNTNDSNTRILGTYNFQLGVSIPIGSTNFNETVRNSILGVGKAAAMLGAGFAASHIPSSRTESTSKVVTTSRNPKTGRQITTSTNTTTTDKTNYNYGSTDRINTAIHTASSVIGNLDFSTEGITANNGSLNNNLCNSVVIVTTKAKTTFDHFNNTYYREQIGCPLGAYKSLKSLSGFTTITSVYLTNENFEHATQAEMAELEHLLYQGFILPSST